MAFDPATLDRLAFLAQLGLTDAERPAVAADLERIIGMVDALAAVDTADVAPLASPVDATQRLRADAVTETDQRQAFQAVAPETVDGFYVVPRVIDQA